MTKEQRESIRNAVWDGGKVDADLFVEQPPLVRREIARPSDPFDIRPKRSRVGQQGSRRKVVDGRLACYACGQWKPLDEFYVRPSVRRQHRDSRCNPCRKIELICRNLLITRREYDQLMRDSGGKCAICQQPSDRLMVDHCHASGKIRNMLCSSCNAGLGLFRDSADVLSKAVAYIEHWDKRDSSDPRDHQRIGSPNPVIRRKVARDSRVSADLGEENAMTLTL